MLDAKILHIRASKKTVAWLEDIAQEFNGNQSACVRELIYLKYCEKHDIKPHSGLPYEVTINVERM